ncbi:MAG: hypothetical protein GY834_14380 [Bacteroidetes bacterium]|nr:hypothetical protein [Bacteroidota bacterium]
MTKRDINNISTVRQIRKSSRLYHSSSIICGVGSLFNIAGSFFEFNYSESGEEADNEAIKRDWEVVGEDLLEAIETVDNY